MNRARIDELLARSPVWAALPETARRALAARATRRRFRAGQRLLGVGDRAVVTLVVGRADLMSVAGDEPIVIRSVTPPAAIGVSVALGAPASAELWAAEPGELISIPGDAVTAAIARHPGAAIAAMTHLAAIVAELSASLEVMRRHGLVDRIRHALAVLARGRRELAITHARLADEVGGTRANVSRALARLEAEGFLRRRRGRIELR